MMKSGSILLLSIVLTQFAVSCTFEIPDSDVQVQALLNSIFSPGSVTAAATITKYTRTTSSGSYSAISGTTILANAGDSAAAATLPFSFTYLGTAYTQVSICSNGFINFGDGSASANNPDLFGTSAPATALAPWWDDLEDDGSSTIQYATTGSSPNRTFTVQWSNIKQTGSSNRFNFQVKLREADNIIEFVYGSKTGSSGGSASIGIKDGTGDVGHFINGTDGSTTLGKSDSAYSDFPASGTSIKFTPEAGTTTYPVITGYTRIFSSTTYASITGTTILVDADDAAVAVPIPFSFTYLGVAYTQINVCDNGFANFGTSSTSFDNSVLFTTTAPQNVLAPWWDNLQDDASSTIQYGTSGTTPNRIFTIQWANIEYDRLLADARHHFQIKLYESDNSIEFVYGATSGTTGSSDGASIGIKDGTGGTFHFIDGSDGSTSSGDATNAFAAFPPTGTTNKFTPP